MQLDFNLPERFKLEYIGPDNRPHRPVMIHRAPFGSMERFVGILIEHFKGAFPFWLAPEQVRLLPIADRHVSYCTSFAEECRAAGLRVSVDPRAEKTGFKVREAQLMKVPYMLVVGDREVEAGAVAVRALKGGDKGARPRGEFLEAVKERAAKRTLELE